MKIFTNWLFVLLAATWAGCAPPTQGVNPAGGFGLPSAASPVGQIPSTGSLAGAATAVGGTAGVPGTVAGASPLAAGQGLSLTDTLVRQLGVTPTQATAGAGSIFSTAKQSMSPTDFAQVSSAVPGMSQYLAAAPSQATPAAGSSGLMGAVGALGGSGSTLGTAASLAGSFQSLGLNSSMVSQFIPVVLQYVQTTGGSSTMGLLQSALLH